MKRTSGFRRIAGAMATALVVVVASPAAPVPANAEGRGSWLPTTPDQWPLVVNEHTTEAQTITRGISHHTDTFQTVGGAQVAQVLNVDLSSPNVRTGVVESHDHLTDPADETISSMAHRTGAVAGINGDFFEIYGSGRPLGMVIQQGRLVKSPNPGWTADLGVRADGSIVIGTESYSATVTDGSASHALTSVNTVNDIGTGGVTRITPDLGATPIPTATVASGQLAADGSTLIVAAIASGVTSLPTLAAGTEALAAGGGSAQWLQSTVKVGDHLSVSETVSPDAHLAQAISGGAILVQNGKMAVPLQGGGENNVNDPVTGLGVTADGKHAIVAVFDGHQPEDSAEGLTRPQLAGWMVEHGAVNAILFDSGGSSQMAGRLPGETQAGILNTPSDGHERPVANGLFFYSTEGTPGRAANAVVNRGQPLSVLAGATVPVAAYATDAAGNPAREAPQVSVEPADLATLTDGQLTAGAEKGRGRLEVRAGEARGSVPLTVVDRLSSLSLSPTAPNLDNGGTQQFTVTATTGEDTPVTLPNQAVSWLVSPATLGMVSASGLFTAAASAYGLATVTASAGGATATASVAVGQAPVLIDPMTDVASWALRAHGGASGSLSLSTDQKAQPSDSGSMDVKYDIPAGQGVKQVVFFPNTVDDSFPVPGTVQNPTAVGVWVKGAGTSDTSGPPLGLGDLTLAESYLQVNGQTVTFYPSTVTYAGWRLIVARLPAGLQYPLSVYFLDFLVINPSTHLSGDLFVSDLEALYSPRPPAPFNYIGIPDNPRWLEYVESPSQFRREGTTFASLDDAHLHADDTNATGSVVMRSVPGLLNALPPQARPGLLQAQGDMSDTGSLANLGYAKSLLANVGIPYHDAVGNHEISQGGNSENVNFNQTFGDTHYAYDFGAARVLVTDNGHGGLLASDPFQVPGDEQYQWLAAQLTANTARVTFVVAHMPAYDPHPIANSQFADRFEAQMFEALLARYQQTHPRAHVIALFGHARGFAEQLLDPLGHQTEAGLPNFTVADAGAQPYAPTDQGGFYNYVLFHLTPEGTVQFAVQPFLASITISAPTTALTVGRSLLLSATGTSPNGDDLAALQVPIADPASHVWSSSDRRVARIDPSTGKVTARHPGTVIISVTSGGVTASTTLTVSA